jgi:acetylornithine deacetylase/succinyl-diaminopimelate desuccinylase-like protein
VNEFVPVDHLLEATVFYTLLAARLLGVQA